MTPTERALIKAIRDNPDDAASAAVYADWLEENGFAARAKFIREPSRANAPLEDAAWRARVSHAPIASCSSATCPKTWSALRDTEGARLRSCERCSRPVRYCTSIAEIIDATRSGSEVASDAALPIQDVRRALEGPTYVPLPTNPPPPRGYREPGQPNVLTRLFGLFRRR